MPTTHTSTPEPPHLDRSGLAPGYPVTLLLGGRHCLVVGGGPVAARKARGLVAAEALVTVVAPRTVTEISGHPDLRWLPRRFEPADLEGKRLVITATGDPTVDSLVHEEALARGVLVNAADDPAHCEFTLPAVARSGDLSVAVSTAGRSPAVATWLRKKLEEAFDGTHARLLAIASEARLVAAAVHGTSELDGWGEALDVAFTLLGAGRDEDARRHLLDAFPVKGRQPDAVAGATP